MKLARLIVCLVCFSLPLAAMAQGSELAFGGSVAFLANDGPSGSDFDNSARIEGLLFRPVNNNLWVEAGLSQTTQTEDADSDNTGRYKLKMQFSDVFAGVRLNSNAMNGLTVFGRAGALYYYSDIDFEESFYDLKPGGKLSEVEEGTGFYLGGGVALKLNQNIALNLELTYREHSELFDRSRNEFDMEELGLALGVVINRF